jgi:hypothetical protein
MRALTVTFEQPPGNLSERRPDPDRGSPWEDIQYPDQQPCKIIDE